MLNLLGWVKFGLRVISKTAIGMYKYCIFSGTTKVPKSFGTTSVSLRARRFRNFGFLT